MSAAPAVALADLWSALGGRAEALRNVTLTGSEPALPSSFAVGTAALTSLAASTLACAEIGRERSGVQQQVTVDMRHAAVEFRSERYCRVEGRPMAEAWDRIAGAYPCGDGGWVRLHTNFAHHRDGVLKLLACAYEKAAVSQALLGWQAEAFETAAADAGLVVTAQRSFEAWDAHPQGRAVASLPLLSIDRIEPAGEAPGPEPLAPIGAMDQPLTGLRVLDLTRIIAGPVCTRVLAAHGADVLLVTAPHLPSIETLVIDTGRGKRSAQLDLRAEAGCEALCGLVRGADVFVQGYRPGALGGLGFTPEALAALRPGIVVASLSAYGHAGPWAGRRGFDSLVQTATGFNVAEAQAAGLAKPTPLPAQVMDHATGCLLACGIQIALLRRAREGGSWLVRTSLAQTGRWLRGLGRVAGGFGAGDPAIEEVRDLLEESDSGWGRLMAVRHAGGLSATPPRWMRPAVPLGTDRAEWISAPRQGDAAARRDS